MKKTAVFLFLLAAMSLQGCIKTTTTAATPSVQPPQISKETVKQVEAQAGNIAASAPLKFSEMKGYFLKNSVKLPNDVNFITAYSDKSFDAALGIAKTMTNTITMADMRKNIVAVIAMKPSMTVNDIKINNAYLVGTNIYIDYEITSKAVSDVGYFISNMKVFEIERPQIVTNVSFSDPSKNITVLPFGKRNVSSPADVDSMVKYYTGTYKGTLPAADGPGINIVLALLPDYTFNMKQTYLNNPDRVFESSGKWAPTEDLSSAVLNYDKDASEQMRFYFIDKNTVEKLDVSGEKINSELYKLRK
ncbi:MAG: copper resistance protein NlpE [Endomicrobia bacterium]|nr:copper resistance protein NlpE [Endomicrobiia bacterium]